MKKNSKEKFIQNASNGSNFFNTCFFRFRIDTLYSQQGFKYILKILFQNVSYRMIYWAKIIFMDFIHVIQEKLNGHAQ